MRHQYAHYSGAEGAPFEVPDGTPILRPRTPPARDEPRLLRDATRDALQDELARAGRVLLLVDDNTRGTRIHEMLPHVDRALDRAGIPDERVTILTAQGTHRRMRKDELEQKIGPAYLRRWRVEQHDYRDDANLTHVGETADGMPVVVNKLFLDHEARIGLGHVGVHAIMGFSGGAKIVLPGICGEASETWTHWTASWFPQEDLLGVMDGPIRQHIEEGARMAGLRTVFNVVMDAKRRVQHAKAGDLVEAQRSCAHVARDLHAATLDAPADIVITDSYPADRDYWQSAKGLYCGTIAVAEGGVIIMASPNPEGVADNHPNCRDLCGLPLEEIRRRVAANEVDDVIGAAIAAYTARIRKRSDVYLVSAGIRPDDVRAMGFTPFASIRDAISAAREKLHTNPTFAVLDGAGGLLPIVRGRNDQQVQRIRRPTP